MGYLPLLIRRCCSTSVMNNLTVHQVAATTTRQDNVQIEGWVQRSQKQSTVNFIWVNDGLSAENIQVVVPRSLKQLVPVGAGVKVSGIWKPSDGAKQNMELLANSVAVVGTDEDPRYGNLSPDLLRRKIHLRSKSLNFAALLRLRSRLTKISHDYFMANEFVHIDTPALTANDCEGAGEVFTIASQKSSSFFGDIPIHLTVSGQLHLEAVTSGVARAYTFSTAFRADKQQSSAHLTEFKMIEAEIAFVEDLEYLLKIVGDYLKTCSTKILSDSALALDFHSLGSFSTKDHWNVLENISKHNSYPRLTYAEAVEILNRKKESVSTKGLNKKNEAFLVDYTKSPVFITHYPSSQKPFYVKRAANNEITESFDFLCPLVGELAGGSIREPSIDLLRMRAGSINWYEECRTRGKPVSGGFGIGFERLLQVLFGIPNIKDTIPFPRWFKHCQC